MKQAVVFQGQVIVLNQNEIAEINLILACMASGCELPNMISVADIGGRVTMFTHAEFLGFVAAYLANAGSEIASTVLNSKVLSQNENAKIQAPTPAEL